MLNKRPSMCFVHFIFNSLLAFNFYFLGSDFEWSPLVIYEIFVILYFFLKKILRIHIICCNSYRKISGFSNDSRHSQTSSSYQIILSSFRVGIEYLNLIPLSRQGRIQMRIIAKDSMSWICMIATDDPTVARSLIYIQIFKKSNLYHLLHCYWLKIF